MKLSVTVELEIGAMPDTAARELARQTVEARGLNVTRVAIGGGKGREKVFTPKAYAPGWQYAHRGRTFSVWSHAPNHTAHRPDLWMVPADRREGDAPVYRWSGFEPTRCHADGSTCRSSWSYADGQRTETPCSHESHERAA